MKNLLTVLMCVICLVACATTSTTTSTSSDNATKQFQSFVAQAKAVMIAAQPIVSETANQLAAALVAYEASKGKSGEEAVVYWTTYAAGQLAAKAKTAQ
jgi:hypothetical protein